MDLDWPDCSALVQSTVPVTQLTTLSGNPAEVEMSLTVTGPTACSGSQRFTITASGLTAAEGVVTFISPPSTATPDVIGMNGWMVQAAVYGIGVISDPVSDLDVSLRMGAETVTIGSVVLSTPCAADWTCMNITMPELGTAGIATVTAKSSSANATFDVTYVSLSSDTEALPASGFTSTQDVSTTLTFASFPTAVRLDVRCAMGSEQVTIDSFEQKSALDATTSKISNTYLKLGFDGQVSAGVKTVNCWSILTPELGSAFVSFEFKLPPASMTVSVAQGLLDGSTTVDLDIESMPLTSLDDITNGATIRFMTKAGDKEDPSEDAQLMWSYPATASARSRIRIKVKTPIANEGLGLGSLMVTPASAALQAVSTEFTLISGSIQITDVTSVSNAACDETSDCSLPSSGGWSVKLDVVDFPFVDSPSQVVIQLGGQEVQAWTIELNSQTLGITVNFQHPVTSGMQTLNVCRRAAASTECFASMNAQMLDTIQVEAAPLDDKAMYLSVKLSRDAGSIGGQPLSNATQMIACSDVFDATTVVMLGGTGAQCHMNGYSEIKVKLLHTYDSDSEPRFKTDPRSELTFKQGGITDAEELTSIIAATVSIALPGFTEQPSGLSIKGATELSLCPTQDDLKLEAGASSYAGTLSYTWGTMEVPGSTSPQALSTYLSNLREASVQLELSHISIGSTVAIRVTVADFFGNEESLVHSVSRKGIANPTVSITGDTDKVDITKINWLEGSASLSACSSATTLVEQKINYLWSCPGCEFQPGKVLESMNFQKLKLPAHFLKAGTKYTFKLEASSQANPDDKGESTFILETGWPGESVIPLHTILAC